MTKRYIKRLNTDWKKPVDQTGKNRWFSKSVECGGELRQEFNKVIL
jgi:hypothetical protein